MGRENEKVKAGVDLKNKSNKPCCWLDRRLLLLLLLLQEKQFLLLAEAPTFLTRLGVLLGWGGA